MMHSCKALYMHRYIVSVFSPSFSFFLSVSTFCHLKATVPIYWALNTKNFPSLSLSLSLSASLLLINLPCIPRAVRQFRSLALNADPAAPDLNIFCVQACSCLHHPPSLSLLPFPYLLFSSSFPYFCCFLCLFLISIVHWIDADACLPQPG